MVAVRRTRGLTDELARLAASLESLDLRGAPITDARLPEDRDRLVRTIRSYLIPKFEAPDGPLLVVFAGPTGAGKSTLVNSLAGLDVSMAGPVRPTTAVPLALASSPAAGEEIDGVDCEVVVGAAPILGHLTLVDTPDIDSTSREHRAVAERLVDQADIVVFVTSAIRYADEVPWEVLRRAEARGATIIPVLNRLGAGAAGVLPDFRRRLADAGIGSDPVRLPEHHLGPGAQRVPSLAVRELRRRLYQVVADRSRQQSQVVNRVFNNLFDQVEELESRVVELSRTLMATAASAGDSMSTIYSLPDESRRHASVEFTPPSGRRTSRWMRRNQPRPAELEIWETGVRQGLVADLESQLRRDVVTVGAPLLDLGHNLSDLTADAGRDLAGAVDGWIEEVHRLAMDDSHHRLVAMVIIASALGPVDSVVTAKVLGGGHLDRIDSARRSLETRLQAVHSRHLERLEEAWQLNMGHPETESLGERLAAVAATYQFADA